MTRFSHIDLITLKRCLKKAIIDYTNWTSKYQKLIYFTEDKTNGKLVMTNTIFSMAFELQINKKPNNWWYTMKEDSGRKLNIKEDEVG